jgi:hypothetical protein
MVRVDCHVNSLTDDSATTPQDHAARMSRDFWEVWLSDYSHGARFRIYSIDQSPDRSPDRT